MAVLCKRNTFGTLGTCPLLLAVDVTPCPYSEVALPSPLSLIPHINNRRTMAGSVFPFRMKHYWTVNACDKGLNVSQSSSFSVFRLFFFRKGSKCIKKCLLWTVMLGITYCKMMFYKYIYIYILYIYIYSPVKHTASKSISIKMRILELYLISLQI